MKLVRDITGLSMYCICLTARYGIATMTQLGLGTKPVLILLLHHLKQPTSES